MKEKKVLITVFTFRIFSVFNIYNVIVILKCIIVSGSPQVSHSNGF